MNDDRTRVCVVGSINMDLVVRSPRLPGPGETLLGGPFSTSPGGKGANQAVAAARMGAAVSFVGRIGDDEHGRIMRGVLEAEGIDASRLGAATGTPTGVALITVAAEGENTIVVAPGANAMLSPADVDAARSTIEHSDLLLMQLETPMQTVARAAEIARDVGTTIVLNAAPGARLPASLLGLVDVLIVNESEGRLLSGPVVPPPTEPAADELEALMVRISGLGVSTSVLTAGPRGALYSFGREGTGRVAACEVSPVDTVGAGDAFCGALTVRLGEHQIGGGLDRMGVMDAVCWACAAGGLATTRHGAIPSLPTRAEVVNLLRRTN